MRPFDETPISWRYTAAAALLALAVAATYLPLRHNEFVNFDDDRLVLGNRALYDLSPGGLGEILSRQLFTPHYKPLVNLSWAAELRLFGRDPGAFHRHNLLLHLLNTLLVLALATRLAPPGRPSWRRLGAALAVAAIWALHPLKVESVAWASERKDVLFAAFYLGSLLAYLRWVEGRRRGSLAASALLALAAMLSKATAITLPAALLLVDLALRRRWHRRRLAEKLPHLAAALVAAYLYGLLPGPGAAGGSLALLAGSDPAGRLAGAAHRHLAFAGHWLAPSHLAPLYPIPAFLAQPGWARMAGYALAHLALLGAVLAAARRRPRLAAAALFYSLTLLPTLVAPISTTNYLSDRYTYLPTFGLSTLAVLALRPVWRWRAAARPVLATAAALLCLALAGLSHRQVRVWRDSETLWTHTLAVQPPHPYAYNNRGAARNRRGDVDGALADFELALERQPDYAVALANRAGILRRRGRPRQALADLDRALALTPHDPRLYRARGLARAELGSLAAARADYDRALDLDPDDAVARNNRGFLRLRSADPAGALADLERALALRPGYGLAHRSRGDALAALGRPAAACQAWRSAARHGAPAVASRLAGCPAAHGPGEPPADPPAAEPPEPE